MPSKMVSDRQKTALALQAAALQHAARVAESFGARGASDGSQGATDVELANLLTKVGDRLAQHAEELVQADDAKLGELHKDQALRDRRDGLAASLARSLSDARQVVDGAFGAGASVQVLGLEGTVGRDPVVIHRKGRLAIQRLETDVLATFGPQLQGVAVDAPQLLAGLRQVTDELGELISAISAERRTTEARLVVKLESMDVFDQEAKWTARLLEGAFGLAGQLELARRVRRTVRRSSAEDVVTELPEPTGQPVADPEPSSGPEAATETPELELVSA